MIRRASFGASIVAAALAIWACSTDEAEPAPGVTVDTEAGAADATTAVDDAGAADAFVTLVDGDTGSPILDDTACVKMDIVFVIDNTPNMVEEQQALASSFAALAGKLDQLETKGGAKIDYRIAATTINKTTNYSGTFYFPGDPGTFPPIVIDGGEIGLDGRFIQACTMTRPWIERGDMDKATNFPCLMNVGVSPGVDFEMPLESVRLALTDRITDGLNGSFLRDDALLAIVIVTDGDDCSHPQSQFSYTNLDMCTPDGGFAEPTSYVPIVDAVKGGRERWAAALIAADETCDAGESLAPRLLAFMDAAAPNTVVGSICAPNLTTPIEQAVAKFGEACQKFKVK